MLPNKRRGVQKDDSDSPTVIQSRGNASAPPSVRPPSHRPPPREYEPSVSDEVTSLFPASSRAPMSFPKAAAVPSEFASAPMSMREPNTSSPDEPSFTIVRPMDLPPVSNRTGALRATEPLRSPSGRPPPPSSARATDPPTVPLGFQTTGPVQPPAPMPLPSFRPAPAPAMRFESDARVDVPPMAISTSNEIVLRGRPTAAWMMMLVVMGLFGGIISAVIARGDGDSLLQAGAAFVDPSRAAQPPARPAAAAPARPPTVAPITPAAPLAPAPVAAQPALPSQPMMAVAAAGASDAKSAPVGFLEPTPAADKDRDKSKVAPIVSKLPPATSPAPVAAAPSPPPVSKPVVAAAPKPERTERAAASTPASRPTKASSSPSGAKKGDDLDSAAAAEKLAREQLERSL